jgi:hypothetical protein
MLIPMEVGLRLNHEVNASGGILTRANLSDKLAQQNRRAVFLGRPSGGV